ncbi:MAG: alkaline phosphatase [Abditibacteriota bacterium]|nr:alkaline phosphatase [Abditibacteriota bacterium]
MRTLKRAILAFVLTLAVVSASFAGKAPKNIILLIGDGMGIGIIASAKHNVKGGRLAMEDFPVTGFSITTPADHIVTDSAASGTAFSTGFKTNNGMIARLPNGKDVNSIRYYAQQRGMKTAIVSVKNITDATPAVFLSHADHRSELFNIAAQIPFSGCDVILGGGLSHFVSGSEGGDVVIRDAAGKETVVKGSRDDGKNVVDDIKAQGYTFVTTKEDMKKSDADKLFGLFDAGIMNTAPDTPEPTLTEMTMKAIDIINRNNKNGFFIMSEAGCIDSGNHANNHAYALQEMLEFDRTIRACLDFAKKDGETLIVITADHDTGSMGCVDPSEHAISEGRATSAVYGTGGHSANWVPVFAYGPGAEYFAGAQQNIAIPRRFASFWGLDLVKLAK